VAAQAILLESALLHRSPNPVDLRRQEIEAKEKEKELKVAKHMAKAGKACNHPGTVGLARRLDICPRHAGSPIRT